MNKWIFEIYRVYISRKYKTITYLKKMKPFQNIFEYYWRERIVSYGEENPDKTFYIIRRESQIEGVCSMFNSVIGHLTYADAKGYIPIVDMKNYYNFLWQPFSRRKRENAWEYYFEQPSGYSLEDVKKSKNVIISDGVNAHKVPNLQGALHNSEIEDWHRIYQKYIKLKPRIEKRINADGQRFKTENVLGVCQRVGIACGKMMGNICFEGYAKTYTVQQMINETEKRMNSCSCNKAFLVIDDKEAADRFKNYFKDRLFIYKRDRTRYFSNGKPDTRRKKMNEDEIISKNISYIKEIFLLARCNCLLCDQSTGAMTAIIINGNQYEKRIVLRVG